MAKSKASVRKGKLISTSVEQKKKEPRRPVPTSAPLSKPKRPTVKKSPAKKETTKATRNIKTANPAPKRKGTGLKSTAAKVRPM